MSEPRFIFRHDLWDGIKEITPKIGDSVRDYLQQGYKVILPEGTCVGGDSGRLIKDPDNSGTFVRYDRGHYEASLCKQK